MRLRMIAATISAIERVTAGITPATNNEPTESVVMEPSSRSISDGGMVSPMAALAESTATAILGRKAAYSGQRVEFDEIMEQKTSTLPAKLAWDAPAPKVEVPIPGRYKVAG